LSLNGNELNQSALASAMGFFCSEMAYYGKAKKFSASNTCIVILLSRYTPSIREELYERLIFIIALFSFFFLFQENGDENITSG
jgi:hypothetical protein